MALVIETRNAHGVVSRTRLRSGTTRLTVKPGDVFRLVDEQTGKAPPKAVVKQLDNSILIDNLDEGGGKAAPSSVELIGFYSTCSISAPCHLQLPEASGSGVVDITPSTAAIGALSDGSFVLHDPATAGSATVATKAAEPAAAGAAEAETIAGLSRPVIYGIGGAAVIGVAAAAGGGGGGGGGGDTNVSNGGDGGGTATPAPAPTPIDPTLKITQSAVGRSGKPVLAGTGAPGSKITLNIDTNGDQTPDIVYQTSVGADGKWMANLGTLKPTTGTLPAAGLTTAASVEVAQEAGGNTSRLPAVKLTADNTAPAAPTLDPVATDNLINAAEAGKPIVLSGQGEANSLIRVSVGVQNVEGTVGADGKWQVELPTTTVTPTTTSLALSVVNTDYAGNASGATTRTVPVDSKPPAAPVIQATGGTDNYVNASEKPAGTTINGTAEANSTVKVTVGAFSQEVKADAAGKWSLQVAAADLPAADGKYDVTATATDAAGNQSAPSAAASMTIDTVNPSLTGIKVGAGGFTRSGQAFTVSGESEVGATVIVDYYPSNSSNAYRSQNLLVAGSTEGENAAWTTPGTFTAPRTVLNQELRLVLSSTDKAGNRTMGEHKFTVYGSILPLSHISEDSPLETRADTLRTSDLLDDGSSSVLTTSSVLGSSQGVSTSSLASSALVLPASTSAAGSSTSSDAGQGTSPAGSTAVASSPASTATPASASSGTVTRLAGLLPPDEQQLHLLS